MASNDLMESPPYHIWEEFKDLLVYPDNMYNTTVPAKGSDEPSMPCTMTFSVYTSETSATTTTSEWETWSNYQFLQTPDSPASTVIIERESSEQRKREREEIFEDQDPQ